MKYGFIKNEVAYLYFELNSEGKRTSGCIDYNEKGERKSPQDVITEKGLKELIVPSDFDGNASHYNFTETDTKITLTTLTDEVQAQKAERELNILRSRRQKECFAIVDRGQLWYNSLTEQQKTELQAWYTAWLAVTETKVIPDKPEWLED